MVKNTKKLEVQKKRNRNISKCFVKHKNYETKQVSSNETMLLYVSVMIKKRFKEQLTAAKHHHVLQLRC